MIQKKHNLRPETSRTELEGVQRQMREAANSVLTVSGGRQAAARDRTDCSIMSASEDVTANPEFIHLRDVNIARSEPPTVKRRPTAGVHSLGTLSWHSLCLSLIALV